MQKQKILISVIIIFILLIVSAGGYFAYQKYFITNNQTVKNKAAGWKTYTNSQYGYQIKYPNDFQVSERPDYSFFSNNDNQANLVLQILSYPAINNQSLQDYVNKNNVNLNTCSSGDCPKFDVVNTKKEIIDGYDAIEQQTTYSSIPGISFSTYFKKENSILCIFSINPGDANKTGITQKDIDIYHQMLSTFKFTNPTSQTAGWKTYADNVAGMTFRYPDKLNSNFISLWQKPSVIITVQGSDAAAQVLANECLVKDSASANPISKTGSVVVLKSTILPGLTRTLQKEFPDRQI